MVVLDTSIIIGMRRKDPRAIAAWQRLRQERTPVTIASVTIFKLAAGTARSKTPDTEAMRGNDILQGQVIRDLDAQAAAQAGAIHGTLLTKGTPIGIPDCMIAGMALHHHEPVLTLNPKDFTRIPGLVVHTPEPLR